MNFKIIKLMLLLVFLVLSNMLLSLNIELKNKCEITNSEILLKDIAKALPGYEEEFQLYKNDLISEYPTGKSFYNIDKKIIIKKYYGKIFKIKGSFCTIRKKKKSISTDYIELKAEQFLRKQLNLNKSEVITFSNTSIINSNKSKEKIHFKIAQNYLSRGKVTLKYGLEKQQKNLLYANIKKVGKIFYLKNSKRRNEIINEKDLYYSEKIISGESKIKSQKDIIGKMAARYIPADTEIKASYIKLLPLIKRNDSINVRVQNGKIKINFKAIAKEEGNIGETITCINPDTKKRFKAKVIGMNLAELRL